MCASHNIFSQAKDHIQFTYSLTAQNKSYKKSNKIINQFLISSCQFYINIILENG